MKRFAIIVAGGSGTRFGGPLPKQFLPLKGTPVLMHTVGKFAAAGAQVVLALPAAHMALWRQLCATHGFSVPHRVVEGGSSRFGSVKNALRALRLEAGDVVAVHDGVRPLASAALIERAFTTAGSAGSAVPVVAVSDSVRQVAPDGTSVALERATLRAVQTPQAFTAAVLTAAYAVDDNPLFTDDASVVEASGRRVTLIEGEPTNIKITHPLDIAIAEEIMDHAGA